MCYRPSVSYIAENIADFLWNENTNIISSYIMCATGWVCLSDWLIILSMFHYGLADNIAHCILYSVQCTINKVNVGYSSCKIWKIYVYIIKSLQCPVYNLQCLLYSVQFTVYNEQLQCPVYNVECTVYNLPCTIYNL